MDVQFGKKTTTESFFDGKPMKKEMTYSIPVKVSDQSQALTEFLKALDLIKSKKTQDVTLRIKAPGFKLQSITREYVIGEEL